MFSVYMVSRLVFREENPPAFFVLQDPGAVVGLGDGFPWQGIRQIDDECSPESVILLTFSESGAAAPFYRGGNTPLVSGELLSLTPLNAEKATLSRSWLPASQRIALSIPLHPDRMALVDWTFLPGIGPKLAERIEADRQKNGDFGSLEALQRVTGIGPKRIESWKIFFE
ncbi:helix-hairpin-helix domain-containing protein [Desulfuromonas sp. AOP6]|uniref:ComEA family DNA-binding protein n=1 Tax=Desulfuromonas sp. AOP6 TaxID=1566351 RepID=UPI001CEC18A3|nr:helix-hairpin-helix domain-containing protein [Desulfuromonas sp. AOP6]